MSVSLHDFRSATERVALEREAEVEKAKKALPSIEKRRVARADLARLETSINDVKEATKDRLAQNEQREPTSHPLTHNPC